jgi:hypothetical protein
MNTIVNYNIEQNEQTKADDEYKVIDNSYPG